MEKITKSANRKILQFSLFLVLLLLSTFSSLSAQCPLGCNNLVQVSLDGECEAEITPEMILEGETDDEMCEYQVTVLGPNDVPIDNEDANTVNASHIGMKLKVRVELLGSSNSCWGYIFVEDKQPPVFDIPCGDTLTTLCYDNELFEAPTATDNCDGPVKVDTLSDIITDVDCGELGDTVSAIRVIIYQATDSQGNVSLPCTRTILYLRVGLDEIEFPENLDDVEEDALEACGDWDLDDDNYPDPWVDLNGNGQLDEGESESGVPTTEEGDFPIFPNNSYCEINATFHDKVIPICENSFKVIRHWQLLDWCTATVRDTNQIIKVLDTTDPEVVVPEEGDIIEFADPYECSADVRIPPPDTVMDCTTVNYRVQYMLADANGNKPLNGLFIDLNVDRIDMSETAPDGTVYPYYYIIRDLPVGLTWIRYIVTDDCENATIEETEVLVIDHVAPIPVCDEFTVVTLTATGFAKVFAETFDDGSHDNCTEELGFEVRRLTMELEPDDQCTVENTQFRDFVEFCCADAGQSFMVELRVWDDGNGSGVFGDTVYLTKPAGGTSEFNEDTIAILTDNYNTCMVVTTVQDKIPPVITCPPDITVDCEADLWNLDIFGTVRESRDSVRDIPQLESFVEWDGPLRDGFAEDNCDVTVTEEVINNLDKCQVGEILRIFTATDDSGRSTSCTQVITVTNDDPFNGGINWPDDLFIESCLEGIGTDPDDLTAYNMDTFNYDYPIYEDDFCSQLAVTYEDQQFNFVDDVCFKILRKWTVIDWCLYDRSGRDLGIYNNTQIIKVNDADAPIIENTEDISFCTFGPGCGGEVELVNGAMDCTPNEFLKWEYRIDLNMNGEVEITGEGPDATRDYPLGTHQVTWIVFDLCGNSSKTTYKFTVLDCKKPTPYCISEITTVIMPTTGEITIWARDFDRESFDNCPGPLRFSFTEPVITPDTVLIDTSMTFTCPVDVGMHELRMYVLDQSNNFDYCSVTINIQANAACANSGGGDTGVGSVNVSGFIGNVVDQGVDDVEVSLQNMGTNGMSYFETDRTGEYAFNEISTNSDFKVAAAKNNDVMNGVSTLDIVKIQRHILGIKEFDDPYKLIAADINNNLSVAASDIIQLRKVILGIYQEFPENTSWKFVNASQIYGDNMAPWEYEEYIMLEDLKTSETDNNFVGVKIGDVDHDARANARDEGINTRSNEEVILAVTNQSFNKGDVIEVAFSAKEATEIFGYQMTLEFNSQALEMIDFSGESIDLTEQNTALTQPGFISMSWNDIVPINLQSEETLFTLTFRARTNNTISNTLEVNSSITTAEAYTAGLQSAALSLEFSEIADVDGNSLFQNRPNPFIDRTTINFELTEDAQTTFTVFDMTGRVLLQDRKFYPAGLNTIELSGDDISVSGVLYYQIETGNFKSTQKMIKINR